MSGVSGLVASLETRHVENMPQRLLAVLGKLTGVTVDCFTASERLSFVSLQRQLGKNIRFGQPPPDAIPMKKADSGEARFEEDPFLTGPVEVVTQQDLILSDTENKVKLLRGMNDLIAHKPRRRLGGGQGRQQPWGLQGGESPSTSGTSALSCRGASLEEGEARETCLLDPLFPGSSSYSRRFGLPPPPSCPVLPAITVHPECFSHVCTPHLWPYNCLHSVSKLLGSLRTGWILHICLPRIPSLPT